jgi:hypothetical protein
MPDQSAGIAYLRKLLSDRSGSRAAEAWSALVARGWMDDQLAAEYVNGLVTANDYQSAAQAMAAHAAGRSGDYLDANSVFNGGFELDPTRSALDWRMRDSPGVTMTVDPAVAHSQQRSMRIHFDGSVNVALKEPSQRAFVPPGRYRFQAYVRTSGLTTNEGLSFGLSGRGLNVVTENLTGSRDWVLVEKELDVPANAGLVLLSILRRPSLRFENRIAGTAWIDDVRLTRTDGLPGTRAGAAGQQASPRRTSYSPANAPTGAQLRSARLPGS